MMLSIFTHLITIRYHLCLKLYSNLLFFIKVFIFSSESILQNILIIYYYEFILFFTLIIRYERRMFPFWRKPNISNRNTFGSVYIAYSFSTCLASLKFKSYSSYCVIWIVHKVFSFIWVQKGKLGKISNISSFPLCK